MRFLIAPFALLITALLFAESTQPAADDLEGIYSVAGLEADLPYTGAATIRKFEDGYIVHVMTSALDEEGNARNSNSTVAIGLRDGNKLSLAWKTPTITGVTVYTIGKDGVLSGRWITLPGQGKERTETLKRIGDLPKAPKSGMTSFPTMAMPDRPDLSPKMPPPIPQISGPTRCGEIQQNGRVITIDGHADWYALHGEIQPDGKLFVVWVSRCQLENGGVALSLYTIHDNGRIVGHWNWANACRRDDSGNWQGLTMPDILRDAKTVEQPPQ